MKRLLALILAFLMTAGVLAGCAEAKQKTDGDGEQKDPEHDGITHLLHRFLLLELSVPQIISRA